MAPAQKLLSVNVSLPREITVNGKAVRTGIFKEPVNRRVQVRTLNIDGDGQADLIGHGGEMRAVLVYSFENYAYWAAELGRTDFSFGQFGENFTVEQMLDDEIHVGDRFRIGRRCSRSANLACPATSWPSRCGPTVFTVASCSQDGLDFIFESWKKVRLAPAIPSAA